EDRNRGAEGDAGCSLWESAPPTGAGGFPPPSQVRLSPPAASALAGSKGSGQAGALTPHCPTHRLLWPKSKCFDYLYGVGEKLLENFPVQATLCLYEDSDPSCVILVLSAFPHSCLNSTLRFAI
uniref:Uncharacterized protein n=1 Tax=Athene cunicularia TaxID=194338 RepID=A0A663M474_ATHCN